MKNFVGMKNEMRDGDEDVEYGNIIPVQIPL